MSFECSIWDGSIVLVADPHSDDSFDSDFDLLIDRPRLRTVDELRAALEKCGHNVTFFSDLNSFTSHIGRHPKSVVFPYWFGQKSRSRHGLVPAICEANGVLFIGADAYAKIVCNDKELSKVICEQSGLRVPRSMLIRNIDQLRLLRGLSFPVIVKPNYEGTSLGISEDNKCNSFQEVYNIARDLLINLKQPVIVEEFIVGREFSACIMGTSTGVELEIGGWKIDGHSDYLNEKVFSAKRKLDRHLEMEFEVLTHLFGDKDKYKMLDCFSNLGKVDLLRVDGRLSAGQCIIIELTPDIYLGADSEFFQAFKNRYQTYDKFISALVTNCVEGRKSDPPVR